MPMNTPDTERIVLLAQIALEGVRMTPEAQKLATMERLQTILGAARGRAFMGTAQRAYKVSDNGAVVFDKPDLTRAPHTGTI